MLALIFAILLALLWGALVRPALTRSHPDAPFSSDQKRALAFAYLHGAGVGGIVAIAAKSLDGVEIAMLIVAWALVLWFLTFRLTWSQDGRPSFPRHRPGYVPITQRFIGIDRTLVLKIALVLCLVGAAIQWDEVIRSNKHWRSACAWTASSVVVCIAAKRDRRQIVVEGGRVFLSLVLVGSIVQPDVWHLSICAIAGFLLYLLRFVRIDVTDENAE